MHLCVFLLFYLTYNNPLLLFRSPRKNLGVPVLPKTLSGSAKPQKNKSRSPKTLSLRGFSNTVGQVSYPRTYPC